MKNLKILVIRNYTVEPILDELEIYLSKKDLKVEFMISGYESHTVELLKPNTKYIKFNPDLVLILFHINSFTDLYSSGFDPGLNKEIKKVKKNIIDNIELIIKTLQKKINPNIGIVNFYKPSELRLDLFDTLDNKGMSKIFNELNNSLKKICQKNKSAFYFDLEHIIYKIGYENCVE